MKRSLKLSESHHIAFGLMLNWPTFCASLSLISFSIGTSAYSDITHNQYVHTPTHAAV